MDPLAVSAYRAEQAVPLTGTGNQNATIYNNYHCKCKIKKQTLRTCLAFNAGCSCCNVNSHAAM